VRPRSLDAQRLTGGGGGPKFAALAERYHPAQKCNVILKRVLFS